MRDNHLAMRRFVLWDVQQTVTKEEWVVIDTETTSLPGQVIQWAICAPDGSLLGSGLVRPTVPIKRDATRKHGLTKGKLKGEPTFDQVAPVIYDLLKGKVVLSYNIEFDLMSLMGSCWPYLRSSNPSGVLPLHRLLWETRHACVMHWFATIYGEQKEWSEHYTWKTLETACEYFGIPLTQAHNAVFDAQVTVQLVQRIADLAAQELPPGFDFFAWEETQE
jgi:DNA polymerase III epsilon subunit-like protein